MKPAIHHALVRANYGRVRIIAVTSERAVRGGWHGRHVDDGSPTHGRGSDVLSRHATLEEAQSRLTVMEGVEEQYRGLSKISNALSSRLHHLHEEAIKSAATGAVPPPLPVPIVVWPDSRLTADQLTTIIRRWLDADDASHFGEFEKALDRLVNPE